MDRNAFVIMGAYSASHTLLPDFISGDRFRGKGNRRKEGLPPANDGDRRLCCNLSRPTIDSLVCIVTIDVSTAMIHVVEVLCANAPLVDRDRGLAQ